MNDYIFNEKAYIEKMIDANYVDNNAPLKTVRLLARYCHFVLGLSKDETYKYIVSYMETYAMEYHEQKSMSRVKTCISGASKKGPWKNIDTVPIRKSELDKIATLNDEKQEKVAFVLLADVKYAAQCSGQQRLASYLSISDIFSLARVPCPYKERPYFMSFLYKDRETGSFADRQEESYGRLRAQIRHKLNYVSYDEEDPIVLELTENNYKELAFTYLNWKNGGYKECKSCGRLFRAKANTQYCKKCRPKDEKPEYKIITCVDCGEEVVVELNVNRKIRCDECQHKKQLEYQKESMRKARESVK